MAELAVSVESAMEYAAQRPKSALMQKNVLELLCTVGRAPVKEILYYTGASMSTVKRLSELGYVNLTEEAALRLREILPTVAATPIVLTDEQAEAFQGLSAQMDRETPGTALLYGVTGSGKTSIYLKLIQKTLDAGKSAHFTGAGNCPDPPASGAGGGVFRRYHRHSAQQPSHGGAL